MIHLFQKVPSKLATIAVSFDAGARAEGDSFNLGLAHCLEHMSYKGTKKRDYQQIAKQIAFLGGYSNAFTSTEQVLFYISVPYENIEPACEILSDLVFRSTFPEEEFQKEREVIKEEEKASQDDVHSVIYDAFCQEFFADRLAHPIIGTQDSIDRFTVDELKSFHQKFYQPSNALVSLCGNYSKSYAKELLTSHFEKHTGTLETIVPIYQESYKPSRTVRITRPQLEHTYVWLGYPGTNFANGDEVAEDILLSILGQGMDSRLFTEVREKRGLVYDIGTWSNSNRDYSSIVVSFSTRPENVEEAISVIESEVEKIQEKVVSKEELIRAKNKYLASTYGLAENSRACAQNLITRRLFEMYSMDELEERTHQLKSSEIKKVARDIFKSDQRLTLICERE